MIDKDKNVAQSNSTSPKRDVFGREALNQAFSAITFPTTKPELIKQVGNHKLEYTKGNPVRLEDLINQCDCQNERFDSRNEVVTAMCNFLDKKATQEKSVSKQV